MANHTDIAMDAAIRSLRDVVAPAVAETAPHILGQVHSVIGVLQLLKARLPHVTGRVEYELDVYLGVAEQLAELGDADAKRTVRRERHAQTARRSADDIELSVEQVCAVISEALQRLDGDAWHQAAAEVLEASERVVEMQRAWFAPQGFSTSATAHAAPSLESILYPTKDGMRIP